jgi:predicted nucleotide-binding protein with TIR-like domain
MPLDRRVRVGECDGCASQVVVDLAYYPNCNDKLLAMPLTDVELGIVKAVVHRFLTAKEPTPRRPLHTKYKSADALERLVRWNVLKSHDGNQTFLPKALAFHYCGDDTVRFQARRAVQMVAHVLLNLYEVETEKTEFKLEDIEAHANKMYDNIEPGTIKLGLYLAPDFGLLAGWGGNAQNTEIGFPVRLNERVAEMGNLDELWDNQIGQASKYVEDPEGAYRSSTLGEMYADGLDIQGGTLLMGATMNVGLAEVPKAQKVFLVHGHNEEIKQSVARYLEKLGLEVIILHEQPSRSKTIIEKVEAHSDVGFAVILLSPDDLGKSKKQKTTLKNRARQNVILELGYFIGKLGREHVCALHIKGVELPSDFSGVLYVSYDKGGSWRSQLAKEISAAGIDVDLKKALT